MTKPKPFIRGNSCYRVVAQTPTALILSDQRGMRIEMTQEKLNRILNRFKN